MGVGSLKPSNAARSLGWTSSCEKDRMGVTMAPPSGIVSVISFFCRNASISDDEEGAGGVLEPEGDGSDEESSLFLSFLSLFSFLSFLSFFSLGGLDSDALDLGSVSEVGSAFFLRFFSFLDNVASSRTSPSVVSRLRFFLAFLSSVASSAGSVTE